MPNGDLLTNLDCKDPELFVITHRQPHFSAVDFSPSSRSTSTSHKHVKGWSSPQSQRFTSCSRHRLHTSTPRDGTDRSEIHFVLKTLTSHEHVKRRRSARSPRLSSCLPPSIPAIFLIHLTIILLQVRPLFAEQRVHPQHLAAREHLPLRLSVAHSAIDHPP